MGICVSCDPTDQPSCHNYPRSCHQNEKHCFPNYQPTTGCNLIYLYPEQTYGCSLNQPSFQNFETSLVPEYFKPPSYNPYLT